MSTLIELARRLRPLIVKAAQSLPDEEAVHAPELYGEWQPGAEYGSAFKVRRNGKVYKARQAHTSQTGWEPENAVSLWECVDETHDGNELNPIPYDGNMALEQGKYYVQSGVVYRCIWSTGAPVYHALSELVGLYVEVA